MGSPTHRQDECEKDASARAGAGRLWFAHRCSLWERDGVADNCLSWSYDALS